MKHKIIFSLIFIFSILKMTAQQTPQFTQYMYNMSVVNPGYTTGDTDVLNLGLIHRNQWSGFRGPQTTSVFAHKAISEKVEAGISYVRDEFNSFLSNNYANANVAYRINTGNKGVISFGMNAGFTFFGFDPGAVILEDTSDSAFNPVDETVINIGAGIYFNTDKFYMGLSAPNMVATKKENEKYQELHTYLTSGYVFDLSDKFKLKPAFMLQYINGAPLSVDVTANVLFNDRFELGAAYRLEESISGLVNIKITPSLRIGYAYDHVISDINLFTSASHEFILLYDLGTLLTKGYEKSPRFF